MKQPFEDVLRDMIDDGCPPICVISDFFLGWTLESCRLFGIPRVVSHGMGVFSMAVSKSTSLNVPRIKKVSPLDPIELSELKIPFTLNIEEIEGDYVGAFESNYCNEAKAYCVGPLLLYDELDAAYIKWLDKYVESNQSGSVIYVSYGTQTHLSNDQMDEIAFGLEMACHPFIWVARSKTWAPPDGWNERVKEEGMVVYDWVEQQSTLAHPSIGLVVPQRDIGGEKITTIDRGVICERVKELMGGEKGRKVKERAQELGQWARHAVEKGRKLDELIAQLTNNM
ncbi:hypothetical protein CMV_009888 [Castanea mollissima]|uniref:Uncharacterized protein n=1 Tax=Castanea mollissima TaxID=60419 RepID=A0A8J4W158_9ROSI|nr:hypothetical protein CMV_009888 [Castanea mollissima]